MKKVFIFWILMVFSYAQNFDIDEDDMIAQVEKSLEVDDITYNDEREMEENIIGKREKKFLSGVLVQFMPAYFYPLDNKFRRAYGKGFIALGEIDFPVYKRWHIWLDSGYFAHEKKSERGLDRIKVKSKVYIIPGAFGVRYIRPVINGFSIYAKVGPNCLYVKTKQNYEYVDSKRKRYIFGATFGVGCFIRVTGGWTISLFSDFLYNETKTKDRISNKKCSVSVSSFVIGGGFGYCF